MTTLDNLAPTRTVAAPLASQATAVEQARAVAEVAAAVKVAQEFPRDESRALHRMREACRQKALAERAFYSVPRAGRQIEGASVHLARELASCWGNIDYGIRELRRDDDAGQSEMQAWAWDQETNTRSSRSFIVPHARMEGKGASKRRAPLTDLGDISNNNNSVAARAVRETIFTVLPTWFTEEAKSLAGQTLRDGGGATVAQQTAGLIANFGSLGVTRADLERRIGAKAAEWTEDHLAALRVIGGSITRGESTREQEFPPQTVTAGEITEALGAES